MEKILLEAFQSQVVPDNLIAYHKKMTGSIHKGRSVDAICSFSKDFDVAMHGIFIAKLVRYKVGKWMVSWMDCCWVEIGNSNSS